MTDCLRSFSLVKSNLPTRAACISIKGFDSATLKLSADLNTGLPKTKAGHIAVCVFVDRSSKMVHFAPCWNDLVSRVCSDLPREVFAQHGIP